MADHPLDAEDAAHPWSDPEAPAPPAYRALPGWEGKRLLFVGEAPSRSSDPAVPLLSGRSGTFLAELLGASWAEIDKSCGFVNLLPHWPGAGHWPRQFARRQALHLEDAVFEQTRLAWVATPRRRAEMTCLGPTLVLLGGRVARAFGAIGSAECPLSAAKHTRSEMRYRDVNDHTTMAVTLLLVPHPSPLNRQWNAPDVRFAIQQALQDALVDA